MFDIPYPTLYILRVYCNTVILSDNYYSLVSNYVSMFGCVGQPSTNEHDDDDDNDDDDDDDDKFTAKLFAGAFKHNRY